MNTQTGGPAFPQTSFTNGQGYQDWPCEGWGYGGMTLRDWFAGQVLVGMLANPNCRGVWRLRADDAYGQADAMLVRREVKDV